jgi:hypothetical protein
MGVWGGGGQQALLDGRDTGPIDFFSDGSFMSNW